MRCQDAALPEDDELMELKLKLLKDDMLGSAIGELSSFSEMGECQRLPAREHMGQRAAMNPLLTCARAAKRDAF